MIKFGLLSTARVNSYALINPILRNKEVVVSAVASRSLERARDYAKNFHIPSFYGSYEALLEDKTIDVVYISTPNSLHTVWVKEALKRKKHVFCEKPLSPTYHEALELCELAHKNNCFVFEGFHYQYHPFIQQLIGCYSVWENTSRLQIDLGFPSPKLGDIRYNPTLLGGAFMHLACYPLHFFTTIFKEDLDFSSIAFEEFVTGVDVSCWGVLTSKNFKKKELSFFCSIKDNSLNSKMRISTNKGEIILYNPLNPILQPPLKEVREFFKIDCKDSVFSRSTYDYQLEYFINKLKEKNISPVVNLRSIKLLEKGMDGLTKKQKIA